MEVELDKYGKLGKVLEYMWYSDTIKEKKENLILTK